MAAIGAAVAVTLGAGGLGISHATSPAGAAVYVPIVPCRLVDIRVTPDTVGPRATPLGPGEVYTITAHGSNGECTATSAIPVSATGLQLNVTAVGATAGTFVTIWPSGDRPDASSLNPQPGAPPIPNAVATGLSGTGQFNVFNANGNVNLLIDVVGYYADHHHDDRYYTKAEVDAAVSAAVASAVATATAASSTTAYTAYGAGPGNDGRVDFPTPADTPLDVVTLNLPAGSYIITASTVVNNNTAALAEAECSLRLGATVISTALQQTLSNNLTGGEREQIGITGGGTLASAGTAVLRCNVDQTNGNYLGTRMVALKVGAVVPG